MILYSAGILKRGNKGGLPERILLQFHHCFQAIEKVGDMSIFDVKQNRGEFDRTYYRLRKGQYRALFFFEKSDIRVVTLEHRSEVYRQWP